MEPKEKELTTLLLKDTKEYIHSHIDEITLQIETFLDYYLKQLVKKQQSDETIIKNIQISFLYTSIYFNNPQFQIDAYDENMYLATSFYSQTFSASWLFTAWEKYLNNIREDMKNDPDMFFREASVQQMATKNLYHLLYYIFTDFKYMTRQWESLENLKQLKKDQDFYISFGEYRDWQRVIYAEHPEIDLFNCEENALLTFRRFVDNRFKRKQFEAWKLTNSQFTKCHFKATDFKETILNDVRFENCLFDEVTFKEVQLYGATFEHCVFKNITFEEVLAGNNGLKADQIKEIFKNTEWIDCVFEDVIYKNCNLSYALIVDCQLSNVQVLDCDVTASDFKNRKEEG